MQKTYPCTVIGSFRMSLSPLQVHRTLHPVRQKKQQKRLLLNKPTYTPSLRTWRRGLSWH